MQKKSDKGSKLYDIQTDYSQKSGEQTIWEQRLDAEKKKPEGSINNLP